MHKTIIWIFNAFKNIFYFLRIVCVFCILLLLFYWIQNLTNANWEWLNFIKPFFNTLLRESDKIYSATYNLLGAVFEFKYLIALIFLIIGAFIMRLLEAGVNLIEDIYRSARYTCKKTEETLLNNKLHENQVYTEKKLTNYIIYVQSRLKRNFRHREQSINVEEQIKLFNDYILNKTFVKGTTYNSGFLYQYNNFEGVDNVLDAFFKAAEKINLLEHLICVQVGGDLKQLEQICKLEIYGKIVLAADTAYRYKFNDTHRYQTSVLGDYKFENKDLQVHELKEIL